MASQHHNQSRRTFLKNSVLAGTLLPLAYRNLTSLTTRSVDSPLKVHIFSKHLQFLNIKDMADAAANLGFDGVDLTVRPNGHILPERVQNDLPPAVDALRKVGFAPLIMTTAIQDAGDATDKQLLETAAKLGFKYYRMNWFKYPDGKTMPESIQFFQNKVKEISELNKKLGLTGCYQNHAGNLVGSSLWELWQLLKISDDQHMGVQYDIRHAVVEGGLSWQNGLRLIESKIKLLAIKDFKWEKINGEWRVQNTPLGEGMVDFKTYFKLLRQYKINVPVSLHLEYPLGGAEHGATRLSSDKQVVFDAMKRDLKKLRELWDEGHKDH
jgi:sugar phosphate isomerase/epimerase